MFFLPIASFAADRVSGANATFDIEAGARSAALGSASIAVDSDYLGFVSNPQQLSLVEYAWASFSHTAYYEDTQYDFASIVLPLDVNQGLGVSFARFGANDIPYILEGEPIPSGSEYNTISIADWMVSVSWGKRFFKHLDVGIGFHGLYREMDQTGWGFRSDLGVRYRIIENLYVSGLLKGWTSSATTWKDGEVEYSSPEFYLAASYKVPVKYLYGRLGIFWQGAEFLHHEARAVKFEMNEKSGARVWEDPLDWLSGGRGGVEFEFDFGLSLRVGLSHFSTFESVTAGAGLLIANFVHVDYAFESHPVLSPVHRLSVSVSPYLFSHSPKKKPKELEPEHEVELLLTEEKPEENPPILENELKKSKEETTEEILEPSAQGGVFWEED